MHIRHFHLGAFRNLFAPRKPRNPLVRLALGLLGVVILAALVVVGLFVGAAMLCVGLLWKLLAARKTRASNRGNDAYVDAQYRVVRKAALPASH